jgi:hypothetical protein
MSHPVTTRLQTPKQKLFAVFGVLFSIYALYRFFKAGWVDSMDFEVYYRTAQIWINSLNPPYEVKPEDRGFVLKQPPWILPFFAPFGWMSFGLSKIVWVFVELGCMAILFRWVLQAGVAPWSLALSALAFWWMWLAHFFAGQINLLLPAAAALAFPAGGRRSPIWARALLPIIFSFKVFPLVALLGRWSQLVRVRIVVASMAILIGLNGLIWLREIARPDVGLSESITRVVAIYQDWPKAAASGGTELGESIVRGQHNHGMVATILRVLEVPATNVKADIYVSFALAVLLSGLWFWIARTIDPDEQWAGWIAIGMLCHTLVWHHVVVWAFPVAALANARAAPGLPRALAFGGTFLIALFVPEVWPHSLITPIELLGGKSWGTIFCMSALVLTHRRRLK